MDGHVQGHEQRVNDQLVCRTYLSIVSCSVASELRGTDVKIECRGVGGLTVAKDGGPDVSRSQLFMRSHAARVPSQGGRMSWPELSTLVLAEGYDAWSFELCRTSGWWPVTVATGRMPLATVYSSIGLDGVEGQWEVPLTSKRGKKLATLTLLFACGVVRLGDARVALRALQLPRRLYQPHSAREEQTDPEEAERLLLRCERHFAIVHQILDASLLYAQTAARGA